ncbi:MAG: VacJ family lipoprotein [Deltaproteobacteria bacterium]|nr:VacJ family lipoprotein [Deltaproteobacteria bacterium]
MGKRQRIMLLVAVLMFFFSPVSPGLAFDAPVSPDAEFRENPGAAETHSPLAPFVFVAMQEESFDGRSPQEGAASVGAEAVSGGGSGEEEVEESISDPLEPINRAFFHFNDKFYFWLLKPIATGYKTVVPEPARVGVKNFFYNLSFPIRFINCIFQGKIEGAANEFALFMVNSTFGLAGFLDVIPEEVKMKRYEEDLGQTLGAWGIGPGFYLNWPILGPSSLRDTIGMAGDSFLSPVDYLSQAKYVAATRSFDAVNRTSLRIGDYEALIKASLDPYIALRDAYFQNRRARILE